MGPLSSTALPWSLEVLIKKIFSELARQWAKRCTWLWRLRSHLDTVQPQLGTTQGVQVKRKYSVIEKKTSGGTIETAMHIKTSYARKHERSSGCDNYIKDSSNICCFSLFDTWQCEPYRLFPHRASVFFETFYSQGGKVNSSVFVSLRKRRRNRIQEGACIHTMKVQRWSPSVRWSERGGKSRGWWVDAWFLTSLCSWSSDPGVWEVDI